MNKEQAVKKIQGYYIQNKFLQKTLEVLYQQKNIQILQRHSPIQVQVKIFHISYVNRGNPARLLKAINPNEAQLLDAASRAHVRFRLGGSNFPPVIYYKIFNHGGICDLNSFAPRDYALINRDQPQPKVLYSDYKKNQQKYDNQGWYLRMDNNGWRPISNKQLQKNDYIELFSSNKIRYYHHKKDKRDEKVNKKARFNKLKWIQSINKVEDKEKQQEFITQTQQLIDLDDDQFDKEVQNLIEWTENLNFDKYMEEWFQLSTSNASENYVKHPINTPYVDSIQQ